jgi:hypothetical protein
METRFALPSLWRLAHHSQQRRPGPYCTAAHRAVARRLALLVHGEEGGASDAAPFERALLSKSVDAVGVVIEAEGRKARLRPGVKRLLHSPHERNDRLAPEGAIGLLVIAECVVARQADEQRRHAEGERDLARGGGFRLGKIHVLGRERQSIPIEESSTSRATYSGLTANAATTELPFDDRALCLTITLPDDNFDAQACWRHFSSCAGF